MNFDGSYPQSIQKGGFGGVIRDSDGSLIRSWFGPVDSSNANEVEVFALLIECCELLKLDGYNAIIEGDFFSYSVGFWEGFSSVEISRLGGGGARNFYAGGFLSSYSS